jgi:hypothetical protein
MRGNHNIALNRLQRSIERRDPRCPRQAILRQGFNRD